MNCTLLLAGWLGGWVVLRAAAAAAAGDGSCMLGLAGSRLQIATVTARAPLL